MPAASTRSALKQGCSSSVAQALDGASACAALSREASPSTFLVRTAAWECRSADEARSRLHRASWACRTSMTLLEAIRG